MAKGTDKCTDIEFDFDSPVHIAYGINWESDGGEFLYKGSPLMGFPAYWKAPENPGEYNFIKPCR